MASMKASMICIKPSKIICEILLPSHLEYSMEKVFYRLPVGILCVTVTMC